LKDLRLDVIRILQNDLEAVTERRFPEISGIKDALRQAGASGTLMSGSGPTVFGCFENRDAADKASVALSETRGWSVFRANMMT
jgi:4-diphosphocytidyl-2-C-methyl-D-erythritol kinase